MTSYIFGETTSGLPIPAYTFGTSGPQVLVLGGVHGDESEGVVAAMGLLHWLQKSYSYRLQLTLVPMLNLDGVLTQQRANTNGVDLNRNLPTHDWSEVVDNPRYNPGPSANSENENQALISYLEEKQPRFVLSLHSWKPLLNVNGDCQPQAQIIAEYTHYAIEKEIGYPTPGCLGTYCGLEREMPTLTYELERGIETEKILKVHVPAIVEALKITEQRG